MGTEISWIAVQGLSSEEVMNALDFEPAPDGERRPKASLRDMGDGWTVVLTSHFGFPTPDRMKALSRGGVAIACSADDRVMYSVARGYRDGEAEWAVEHDGGSHGPTHMAVAGRPPPHWSGIRARLTKQQKREDRGKREVDYLYDAPMELAASICGYSHDRPRPKGQELKFTLLVSKTAERGLAKAIYGLFKRG